MDTDNITVEDADKMLMEGSKIPAPEVEQVDEPEVTASETEETAVEGVEATETTAQEVPDAWMEQVPEAVRDRVKEQIDKLAAAEQRIRSDDGRVAAFQRQANDLKRKLESMQKVSPQSTPAAELPSTPEEWQLVVDHDPVLAKAIEARVKAEIQDFKKTNLDPLTQRQVTLDELREIDHVALETARLEEAIPGATEIYKSPMFQGWLENEAPPYMQRAMRESQDHRDYIAVFKNFAVDMVNTGRMPMEGEQVAPATANSIDPRRAQDIADNRAKKLLQTAVGSKHNLSPATSPQAKEFTTEDAEAMLLAQWNKNNK